MRGWLVHKPGFVPHSGTHASTEKAPAVEAVQSNLGQAPAECWARNRNVQQFFNCDKIADMVDKGQNSLQKTTSEVATPGGRDGNTARMIHVNHRGRTHEPSRTSEQSVRGLYLWHYGLGTRGMLAGGVESSVSSHTVTSAPAFVGELHPFCIETCAGTRFSSSHISNTRVCLPGNQGNGIGPLCTSQINGLHRAAGVAAELVPGSAPSRHCRLMFRGPPPLGAVIKIDRCPCCQVANLWN